MALGEVAMKDYLRLAWKESRVGLALGLSMSATVFVIAWVRSGTEVALVVSLAMVVVVAFGSMVGMSLPFIFQRLKMDPAAASGPLVTSVADVMGVLIYLGIASALLGHLVPAG
jgi:magnesium transporter